MTEPEDNNVVIYVEEDDGSGNVLPIIDALGMAAFASAHFSAQLERDNE
jgi:hypothetical protein